MSILSSIVCVSCSLRTGFDDVRHGLFGHGGHRRARSRGTRRRVVRGRIVAVHRQEAGINRGSIGAFLRRYRWLVMLRLDRTALGEQLEEFADDFRVLDRPRDGDV